MPMIADDFNVPTLAVTLPSDSIGPVYTEERELFGGGKLTTFTIFLRRVEND